MMATPSLHHYGTPELKEQYLAPAIAGTAVTSIAVTEPDTGSDVARLRTRAVRDGDDWVITGRKFYITNGAQADWLCLLARTSDEGGYRGMSQIVVTPPARAARVAAVASPATLRGVQCTPQMKGSESGSAFFSQAATIPQRRFAEGKRTVHLQTRSSAAEKLE